MSKSYIQVPQHDHKSEEPEAFSNHVVVQELLPKSKIYPKRWFILFIFICSSMINTWQWIQYVIITNIFTRYYNVSDFAIEMTSLIYMFVYIPLILPSSFIVDKWGLRSASILGALGTAIGSWVKVFSVDPNRFALTFFGQTLLAISQTFILSTPPRLAAVWFGPDQVSTACSLGVFGIQLGVAVGFIVTPILVENHENVADIGHDMYAMFIGMAIIATICLLLVLICFKNTPKLPPSPAKEVTEEFTLKSFVDSLKRLLTNQNYNLLLISYGINVGIYLAISTLLNQIILTYFENGEQFAGQVGLIIVITGMFGSVACGMVLDQTRKYKETTLGVYVLTLIGLLIFTFTLQMGSKAIVYATTGVLGFFMTGYLPVGFELAAELTYPEPENTSAGLLNASTQIFGIIFTLIYSAVFSKFGDIWANLGLCATLVVGIILTALVKSDLRRQAALARKKTEDEMLRVNMVVN